MQIEVNTDRDFASVLREAQILGYTVVESDCDCWDYATRTITINKRRTPRNKVIHFLHEVGHAHLCAQANLNGDYYERFPGLKAKSDLHVHYISEFEQETLAWEQARLIAYRLDIPVDRNFHQIKNRCLRTYATK